MKQYVILPIQKYGTSQKLKEYYQQPETLYNNSQIKVQGIVKNNVSQEYHNYGTN